MLEPPALHPVDDKLRVLVLRVRSASGEELALQVPWDRSAFDVEPVLVAGTAHEDPDRTLLAFAAGAADGADLLEVPLGKALRHDENPDGADSIVLHVETTAGGLVEYTLACAGLAEPEAHRSYPRAIGEVAERRVGAYLASEEPEWFCDGSSTLSCCATHREAPHELDWVAI